MDSIINNIAKISGLITSIGIILAFFKPIRNWMKDKIYKNLNKSISPDLQEIKDGITSISNDISKLKKESDQNQMQHLRYECLCFASDLRKGIPKTRQEYEEIFRMESSYEDLVKKYKIKNGYMEEEMKYIHRQYKSLKSI